MKNQADYSLYKCPYSHLEKDCGHELHGPEGSLDDNTNEPAYRVWCSCGFRGPAFCLDPEDLKLEEKALQPAVEADIDGKLYAINEAVNNHINDLIKYTLDLEYKLKASEERAKRLGEAIKKETNYLDDSHLGQIRRIKNIAIQALKDMGELCQGEEKTK
jgi:hypothetical protein